MGAHKKLILEEKEEKERNRNRGGYNCNAKRQLISLSDCTLSLHHKMIVMHTKKKENEKVVVMLMCNNMSSSLLAPINVSHDFHIFMFLVGLLLLTQRHSIVNYPIKII